MDLTELGKQLVYLPDMDPRLLAVPVAAVLAAGVAIRDSMTTKRTVEEFAADFRENDALLNQAIVETESEVGQGQKVINNRRRRVGPMISMVSGLIFSAGAFAAQPSIESTVTAAHGNVVVLVESSDSMTTSDMTGTQNRFEPLITALRDTNYAANIAVEQFGGSLSQAQPLGKLDTSILGELSPNPSSVNPTEADIVSALQDSSSQLPFALTSSGVKTDKRSGEILLYSDGDAVSSNNVAETQPEVAQEVDNLEAEGIQIKVVVPGTKQGTFSEGGSTPQSSAIDPGIFASLKNVFVSSNSSEVISQVNQDLIAAQSDKVISRQRLPSYLLYIPGIGLLIDGIARYRKRVIGKVISE